MEDELEWEDFPDELISALDALEIQNAEAVIVVGFDPETQRPTMRSFAQPEGTRDPFTPDPPEQLADLTVLSARLVTNSPARCYWNGKKWVCY